MPSGIRFAVDNSTVDITKPTSSTSKPVCNDNSGVTIHDGNNNTNNSNCDYEDLQLIHDIGKKSIYSLQIATHL
jgi:hypothetical protein